MLVELSRLEHPQVRDLAWVMAAPSLIDPDSFAGRARIVDDDWSKAELARRMPELLELDRDTEAVATLEATLAPAIAKRRLGVYCEALLEEWMRRFWRPERTAHHLAVRSRGPGGPSTIGEFDFLFAGGVELSRIGLHCPQHWEAAVKFYLCVADSPDGADRLSSYVGTEIRDRLDLKLDKLFGQQLRLGEREEARPGLEKHGFGAHEPRAWMKGRLFYPSSWRELRSPVRRPREVSPGYATGSWTTVTELARAVESETRGESAWVALNKHRWLSPARVGLDQLGELIADPVAFGGEWFARTHAALMLARLERAESGDWEEASRLLVVHADWPRLARESQTALGWPLA